ncbi:MAG: YqaJ viral recombinase family protein, partial [Treponema sp.]|nr:YqaJ viral recombinase family protein [Treponema sp.]
DINFITCHIDGYYDCPKNEYPPILHEGKTTNARSFFRKPNDPDDFNNMWGTPGTGHIPRVYQVQVQHQMLCTGAGEAIVSVLIFPETPDAWEKMGWVIEEKPTAYGGTYHILYHKVKHKKDGTLMGFIKPSEWANTLADMGYFHQYPVKANPEAQRMMVERYREFWHKHVLAGIPPEPRDYDDIKRLFVEPVGTIVCDAAMTAWWREYDAIRKEIGQSGAAAKRQAKLKLRILNQARKLNPVMDDESQEKIIFRDSSGNKLGQYSLKGGFR